MIFAEKQAKKKTNTNADKALWEKEHPKLQLISFCAGHLFLSLFGNRKYS